MYNSLFFNMIYSTAKIGLGKDVLHDLSRMPLGTGSRDVLNKHFLP